MLGNLGDMIDLGEVVRRAVKYLVEGIMVANCSVCHPKESLNLDEVLLIALTAAATFSILDTYVPSMQSVLVVVQDLVLRKFGWIPPLI